MYVDKNFSSAKNWSCLKHWRMDTGKFLHTGDYHTFFTQILEKMWLIFNNCKGIIMKFQIIFPQIKSSFCELYKLILNPEIFCENLENLKWLYGIFGKIFRKLYTNFGEISEKKKLMENWWNFQKILRILCTNFGKIPM